MKAKFYKTIVRLIIMYISEYCALNEKDEIQMKITEIRMLRWMCSITKLNKIKNEYKNNA